MSAILNNHDRPEWRSWHIQKDLSKICCRLDTIWERLVDVHYQAIMCIISSRLFKLWPKRINSDKATVFTNTSHTYSTNATTIYYRDR